MRTLWHMSGISLEEAHHVWNMGTGMVVATPHPDKLEKLAGQYAGAGIEAKQIGEVVAEQTIRICQQAGDLVFDL